MKLITIILLLAFIVFRNSFTLIKGKRGIKKVVPFVYWGRKIIEIFINFLIPILLIFELIKTNIYVPLYYVGVVLSIVGLLFMIWTRFNRDKDWGFMGDDAGDILFITGPYRFTRHPYYIGAILVGLGIYFQLNYTLVILMLPVIIFILIVIKKEDRFLETRFGPKYLEYKNKVGLFPWFY